jgi:hypothetical protein
LRLLVELFGKVATLEKVVGEQQQFSLWLGASVLAVRPPVSILITVPAAAGG